MRRLGKVGSSPYLKGSRSRRNFGIRHISDCEIVGVELIGLEDFEEVLEKNSCVGPDQIWNFSDICVLYPGMVGYNCSTNRVIVLCLDEGYRQWMLRSEI